MQTMQSHAEQIVADLPADTPGREVVRHMRSHLTLWGNTPAQRYMRKRFYRYGLTAHAQKRA